MSKIDVSIILPVLNEKENLLELIPRIKCVLNKVPHEIIIVDDGSSDGTRQAVKDLKAAHVRLIAQPRRKGFARSIYDGMLAAKGENVVVMDADFNHDPEDLKQLLSLLRTYDCVSASRFLGGVPPRFRFLVSRMLGSLVVIKTNLRMTDLFFGFWGMRRSHLDKIPSEKIFFGFGDYTFRFFYFLNRAGLSIAEFPSVHGRRRYGRPNRRLVRTFFKYLVEIIVFQK